MSSSTPISPFASARPPPIPLVVLLSATDLFIQQTEPALVHCDLNLTKRRVSFATTKNRFHPYSRSGATSSRDSRSPAPIQTQNRLPSQDSSHNVNIVSELMSGPDESLQRELSSPLSSPPSSRAPSPNPPATPYNLFDGSSRQTERAPPALSKKLRISRPPKAGRSELGKLVNWSESEMKAIKDQARKLIREHLNPSESFSFQDPKKVDIVRKQMIKDFPILDNYENEWPIEHLLMSLLKYSSAHSKESNAKDVVEHVNDLIEISKKAGGRAKRTRS